MKDYDQTFSYKLRLALAYRDALRNYCKPVSEHYFKKFRQSQLAAARRLHGKPQLEVAFLLTIPGMWKSDALFEEMTRDPRYHPYVVIYPYSIYKGFEKDEVMRTLERTRQFVEQKHYEYWIPYDEKSGRWLDLKKERKPDIVFFSTPYKDSLPMYYVHHFRDTLTCYVPYGFSSLNLYKVNYDLIFHNLVGVHFVETELHRKMASEHSRNHGANIVVTGYPATEVFLRKDYVPQNQWKPQPHPKKKVIYAPHHSIDKADHPSVFLETCEDMLRMAEKFSDTVQFVFKPHQLLKFKLQQLWGAEKAEAYYRQWDSMENTQLVSDGYVDLFLTSDAMIHDCGSFTTEYLFVKKPVMYLCGETEMTDKFNEFGVRSFGCHYQGHKAEQVERFLQEVVVEGNDPMRQDREVFYDTYLRPHNDVLPSKRILEVIENMIEGKETEKRS